MAFDPDDRVTLHEQGVMTLRTAVVRVLTQQPRDTYATIFREGEPPILDLADIEKIAASWGGRDDA